MSQEESSLSRGMSFAGGVIVAVVLGVLTLVAMIVAMFVLCAGVIGFSSQSRMQEQEKQIERTKQENEQIRLRSDQKNMARYAEIEKLRQEREDRNQLEEVERKKMKVLVDADLAKMALQAERAKAEAEIIRIAHEKEKRIREAIQAKEDEKRLQEQRASEKEYREAAIKKALRPRSIEEVYDQVGGIVVLQGVARCRVFAAGNGRFIFSNADGKPRVSAAVDDVEKKLPIGETKAWVKIQGRVGGSQAGTDTRLMHDCTLLEVKEEK